MKIMNHIIKDGKKGSENKGDRSIKIKPTTQWDEFSI